MAEDAQTQTQTQGSQVEWSQGAAPSIPVIWGRLYRTSHKHCWRSDIQDQDTYLEYLDLISEEFSLGRSLMCDFIFKKDNIKDEVIKNVSKLHFLLKRDNSVLQSPAVLKDCSYNGTFVNGVKVGKGKSRVLDDNDEISITHPNIKIFVFKDHQKNEQDQVPHEVSHKYYISRTLGQGACGVVKLIYNKQTCERHALKIIKKNRITNTLLHNNNLNNSNKIRNEVNILRHLKHPFIISTDEIFEAQEAVYIVMELAEDGELLERINSLEKLTERQTRLLFRQIVLAVEYLHSQGITHRDLKPENVMLVGKGEDTIVKITDFGLSKFVGEDSFMKTMCGTPLYLAPEVLKANGRASYGPEVDVWSLGVIFFICLSGYLPFSSEYKDLPLQEQILRGRYTFAESHWSGVSMSAKKLMRRMLTVQPERRITLQGILKHDWMKDEDVKMHVDELLGRSCVVSRFRQLSVTSATHSGEDAHTLVCASAGASKRMLSNDSLCEPVAKKVRVGSCAPESRSSKENLDPATPVDAPDGNTNSTRSYGSNDSSLIILV